MQASQPVSFHTHNHQLGLKPLTVCHETDNTHHNSCIMTSAMLSPPAYFSSSFLMGDYIGMESCFDLNHNHDVHQTSPSSPHLHKDIGGSSSRGMRDKRPRGKTEFPPPIPLLARTENLTSHMPWVLRRHYTTDGRLILTEEKVKHHEYFRAHRSNGRLTLQLVPLEQIEEDDDDDEDEEGEEEEEEFPFEPEGEENEDEEGGAEGESVDDGMVWKMEEIKGEVEEMGGCDNNNKNKEGSAGKCMKYDDGYNVVGMGGGG